MAVRVTDAEVKEIIDTEITTTAFITVANLMVNRYLVDKISDNDLLKEIERWLAAHLVAVRDPRQKSVSIGSASTTFHGNSGLGLDFTPYGQQVKLLDYTGELSKGGLKRATFEVISETDSAEYDEWEE
ncbi:MAG: hypothetical protein GX163_06770 [Bacteroidetes bacterium]|jgi:hypothetical protein|nr:hypothetical protein [Bacteroidota bacterium]